MPVCERSHSPKTVCGNGEIRLNMENEHTTTNATVVPITANTTRPTDSTANYRWNYRCVDDFSRCSVQNAKLRWHIDGSSNYLWSKAPNGIYYSMRCAVEMVNSLTYTRTHIHMQHPKFENCDGTRWNDFAARFKYKLHCLQWSWIQTASAQPPLKMGRVHVCVCVRWIARWRGEQKHEHCCVSESCGKCLLATAWKTPITTVSTG